MTGFRLLQAVARAILPREDQEFILGDLEELHPIRTQRVGRLLAFLRGLLDLFASATSRWGARLAHHGRVDAIRDVVRLRVYHSDLRHILRSLSRRPFFLIVAVLTLGVGVGSAGAVLGIVDQYVLQPTPGVGADRDLVSLRFHTPDQGQTSISWSHLNQIRREASGLSGLAGFFSEPFVATAEASAPIQTYGYLISGDYFELLRVLPATGRLLFANETGPSADPTQVVISEYLWGAVFDRSPDVVGRSLSLNGVTTTVVGVAGGHFRGTDRYWPVDLWLPYSALGPVSGVPEDRLRMPEFTSFQFLIAGRDGTLDLRGLEEQVDQTFQRSLVAMPLRRVSDVRAVAYPGLLPPSYRAFVGRALAVLGAVVFLVLLIPCANVANLLLVRGAHRRSELAIRRAMGASRMRLAGLLLLENLLLAMLGVLAGLAVASVISLAYAGESPWGLPALNRPVLDRSAFLFAATAVVGTTVVFGTLPAWLGTRFDVSGSLRSSSQQVTRGNGRAQKLIATLQVALVLPLLVTALLLVHTLREVYERPLGLEPEGVYASTIETWFLDDREEGFESVQREVLAAVGALPGVERVALDMLGPYAPMRSTGRIAPSDRPDSSAVYAEARWATPDWFNLLEVPLLSGRAFIEEEWSSTREPSVILSAPLARRLFGGTDVAGRLVSVGGRELQSAPVVGVVGEVRVADPKSPPDELFFLSYPPDWMRQQLTVLVSMSGAQRFPIEVQEAIESAVPGVPVSAPELLTARIDSLLGLQRLFGRLLALLAALAIGVAAVGLYGVVASSVANRRREFGIRIALGAQHGRVVAHAVRPLGFILTGGIVFGLAGSYAMATLIESFLVGVRPLDGVSYALALAALAGAASVACWLPARAAASTDPLPTLRAE